MTTAALEDVLRNFDQAATRIRATDRRQTWRFEFEGRAYFLYFYPRDAQGSRWLGRNPSHREFFGLQTLQKASVPSPRAVAQLSGFRIEARLGDAVIVEAIEPSKRLDEFLLDMELRAEPVPNRRHLALQLRTILHQLGRAGLGHESLCLSNFLVSGNRLYLRDGGGLRSGGLRQRQIMKLAHDAARFATISELRRAWDLLVPATDLPRRNPQSPRLWRRFMQTVFGDNEAFGTICCGSWKGVFTKRSQHARRWAASSALDITRDDWEHAWPILLRQIERGQLAYLKRDASGEVLAADITLAGKIVPVIIKRPRRKFWWTYIVDLGRAARARRTWSKVWQVIIRNLPTEWPMLLMEKRRLGYVTDAVIIFERVAGATLDKLDLDSLPRRDRETLFRRCGRVLRKLEQSGLGHYDAKSTNWMVVNDEKLGPIPVLIDVYGIERLSWRLQTFGIRRLLRAMQRHPQYTSADSLALCQGFAPWSAVRREDEPQRVI